MTGRHIFISHASRDAMQAQALVTGLEAQGVRCWISSRDVAPGANYQEAIVEAIRCSHGMAVLISEAANASEEIRKELSLASAMAVAVYPIRLGAVELGMALRYELATRQWIACADGGTAALRLSEMLRGLVAAPIRRGAVAMPPTRYCRTADGVRLAYAVAGEGPKLVMAGRWFTHLEYTWDKPLSSWGAAELAQDFTLLRYDARGNGMSDWEVGEISHERWVEDLGAVVDAAGFERFALMGTSQSVSVALCYAALNPERVSHLVITGGYPQGWRTRPGSNIEQHEAMGTLIRVGWGEATFRKMFSVQLVPDGSKADWDELDELQRISASPDVAARVYEAMGDIDVVDMLPLVRAPTLVMHAREDGRVPFATGQQLAAAIPGARFVALPGRNHVLLPGSPAMARYLEEVRLFLG